MKLKYKNNYLLKGIFLFIMSLFLQNNVARAQATLVAYYYIGVGENEVTSLPINNGQPTPFYVSAQLICTDGINGIDVSAVYRDIDGVETALSSVIRFTKDGSNPIHLYTKKFNAELPVGKTSGKIYLKFNSDGNSGYSTNGYSIINYGGMPTDMRQYAKENGLMPTVAKTLIYANDTTPILTVGSSIYSPNQQYRITLQTDGNVVIYKKTGTTTETGIWSTRTQNSDPKPQALFFQTDANLVLYLGNNINTTPIWNSQRYTHLGFNLTGTNAVYALQDDGNFVFYWKYMENGQEKTWVLASSDTQNGLSPHSGNLLH